MQITRQDEVAKQAHRHARLARQRAIDDFNRRYKVHASFSNFEVGMWVLRHETWLDGQKGNKELWRWSGPYIIHEKRENDSYVLRELDGTVMRGHVTAHRLKLFFYRTDQEILRTVSPARFAHLSEYPNEKLEELQPFYARYASHITGGERISRRFVHLIPTVTYLSGDVHYPENADLVLPRLAGAAYEIRELFDYEELGVDMCRLERSATHAAYLGQPELLRRFNLDHVDLAITDHYFSNLPRYVGWP